MLLRRHFDSMNPLGRPWSQFFSQLQYRGHKPPLSFTTVFIDAKNLYFVRIRKYLSRSQHAVIVLDLPFYLHPRANSASYLRLTKLNTMSATSSDFITSSPATRPPIKSPRSDSKSPQTSKHEEVKKIVPLTSTLEKIIWSSESDGRPLRC